MRRAVLLAAMLIAILSISACGGFGGSSGGEEAADFSVSTIEGDEFNLVDKRGEVVAFYFLAAY